MSVDSLSELKQLRGASFLDALHFEPQQLRSLSRLARDLKAGGPGISLERQLFGMLFFNPSVRTRVSCESAMTKLGGAFTNLSPGRDTWNFEHGEKVCMDGATQEHVRELAPVLSRLCDVIGIRRCDLATTRAPGQPTNETGATVAGTESGDAFLERFVEHASVPVINLESNRAHPLQGLADMTTLEERFSEPRGKKYVLTWAWHPKPLPVATPHSQLVAACDLGLDVTLLRPEGQDLDESVVRAATERARSEGGKLTVTDDIDSAYDGADVICAKSWSGPIWRGRGADEHRAKAPLRERWIVDEEKFERTSAEAFFMHCLPVRRGVVVTDGILDSGRSAVIDEAENRLWTAAAVLCAVLAP